MKKFLFLAVIGLTLAGIVYGAGEYSVLQDTKTFAVTTDGGGDSTTGTGYVYPGKVYGFRTLHSRIVVGNASPTYAGLGVLDTAWIRLYTTFGDTKYLLDSNSTAGLPCSLITILHSNVGDTLLREGLQIDVVVYDSLGDSSFTATYPVTYQINLK